MPDLVQDAHDEAAAQGLATYTDPDTGYSVFTSVGLKARGKCCGCGCRHCPFQHAAVNLEVSEEQIRNPAWLTESIENVTTVLFWSGGKDSYLALRTLMGQDPSLRPALLTTFDAQTQVVAHQEIPVSEIVEQAKGLGVPLLGVPLMPGVDYVARLERGLALVPTLRQLAFGDLHLRHIRKWREEALAEYTRSRGIKLLFPVWKAPYEKLLADIEASGIRCTLSATTHPALKGRVGEVFNAEFVASLPPDIDGFGENGEFHTRISHG